MPQLSLQRSVVYLECVHGNVKIFAFLYVVTNNANERKNILNCGLLIGRIAERAIPHSLIDHKFYMRLCLTAALHIRSCTVFSDELVGICFVQDEYFDLEVLRQKYFNGLSCCLHTRRVAIIIDDDFAGKPGQKFYLFGRQRRSQTGDYVANAELVEDDQV